MTNEEALAMCKILLEAMLDKVPSAKVIAEQDGVMTITAESYGDGLLMWLRAQGDKVQNIW